MLRLELCDYSDAYIVVKRRISVKSSNIKINNTFINNLEDFDIPMYNLLEYFDSYTILWKSLWNYYRYELHDDAHKIVNSCRVNSEKTKTSKSFEYKTKYYITPVTATATTAAVAATSTNGAKFQINSTKIICQLSLCL